MKFNTYFMFISIIVSCQVTQDILHVKLNSFCNVTN